MVDQPLNCFRQIAMAVVVARLDPPSLMVSRRRSIAAFKSPDSAGAPGCCDRPIALEAAEVAHGGGEPILEIGVEAVLRLAGLQSRKPSTSEPARPNSEDENEMPMPLSGAASLP